LNFAVNGVQKAIAEARKVYQLFHAETSLMVQYPDCEHDFPPSVREAAYQFIDRVIGCQPRRQKSFE
jgi:hypothetical protein